MLRVHALERAAEPVAALPVEARQDDVEVLLVLLPRVLCLEEEDDLRTDEGDLVRRPLD